MFRSVMEKKRQYLVANLNGPVPRVPLTKAQAKVSRGLFATKPPRFPPIDDVFSALDSVASQVIAA